MWFCLHFSLDGVFLSLFGVFAFGSFFVSASFSLRLVIYARARTRSHLLSFNSCRLLRYYPGAVFRKRCLPVSFARFSHFFFQHPLYIPTEMDSEYIGKMRVLLYCILGLSISLVFLVCTKSLCQKKHRTHTHTRTRTPINKRNTDTNDIALDRRQMFTKRQYSINICLI